jgi:peptidoglycan hydrolase FlgJ
VNPSIRVEGMTLDAPFLSLPRGSLPLRPQSGSTLDPTAAARATETAREFEATLLGMLLKEMRQPMEEDGGLFPGDSGDVQGGLFDLFMGKYLADAGGIGMAPALERQLRNTYAPVTKHERTPAGGSPVG